MLTFGGPLETLQTKTLLALNRYVCRLAWTLTPAVAEARQSCLFCLANFSPASANVKLAHVAPISHSNTYVFVLIGRPLKCYSVYPGYLSLYNSQPKTAQGLLTDVCLCWSDSKVGSALEEKKNPTKGSAEQTAQVWAQLGLHEVFCLFFSHLYFYSPFFLFSFNLFLKGALLVDIRSIKDAQQRSKKIVYPLGS